MKPAGRVTEGRTLLLQSKKNWEVGNRKWEVGILLLTSYFLLLTSVFLSGCASTDRVGRLEYDLINLRSEVKGLKKPMQERGQLNKRLKGLEEEQKATGKAVSDLLMKVQSLTTELQILTGRLDEVRYFSEKSSKELTESKDTLIAQIKGLEISVNELKEKLARLESAETSFEKQKPDEETKKAEEEKSEEPKESRSLGTEREVKDAYMEAYKTFKENKFTEARKKFVALLKDYPENEYSDNAQFWIGESYYKEKNYEDAILAYEELLKKNPGSDKVPGALLKQGLAFYELKDEKTGKILLEKVIEQFPDSEQAKIAKKKISPPASTQKRVVPTKKKR